MKTKTTFEHMSVPHGITTKHGGKSHGYFGPMNTSFYGEDVYEDVLENLATLLKWVGKPIHTIYATRQVHGTRIISVDDAVAAESFVLFPTEDTALNGVKLFAVPECDGLITQTEGVLLLTYYADCVPILVWDPSKKAVGTAHSGWRGTVSGMPKELVDTMVHTYGSSIDTLRMGIGHAAGVCCYEVGQDVRDAFEKTYAPQELDKLFVVKGDKYHVDLKQAIELQLLKQGIDKGNLIIEKDCTMCASENGEFVYHSHRRDGLKRGSMSAFIAL